jgi:hypothetical protein
MLIDLNKEEIKLITEWYGAMSCYTDYTKEDLELYEKLSSVKDDGVTLTPHAWKVEWTEVEREWGPRPYGYTLHLTEHSANGFIKHMKFTNSSDYYYTPSKPQLIEINDVAYKRLMEEYKKQVVEERHYWSGLWDHHFKGIL